MKATIHGLCLLYTMSSTLMSTTQISTPTEVICMQTGETLNLGNEFFMQMEAVLATRYEHKPRSTLREGRMVMVNGSCISLANGKHFISQPDHLQNLQPVPPNSTLQRFFAERPRLTYLPSVSRPDLTYRFAACSQFSTPTTTAIALLYNTIALAHKHPASCLKYLPLKPEMCHIAVLADSSIANNSDMSSKIGLIIFTVDDTDTTNILHYGSIKSSLLTIVGIILHRDQLS